MTCLVPTVVHQMWPKLELLPREVGALETRKDLRGVGLKALSRKLCEGRALVFRVIGGFASSAAYQVLTTAHWLGYLLTI